MKNIHIPVNIIPSDDRNTSQLISDAVTKIQMRMIHRVLESCSDSEQRNRIIDSVIDKLPQ